MTKEKMKPFDQVWSPLPHMKIFEELYKATKWAKKIIKEIDIQSKT